MSNRENAGHHSTYIGIEKNTIVWGTQKYPYSFNGFDTPPHGVKSVELIKFRDQQVAQKMDAAILTVEKDSQIPIQHFTGPRVFVDKIISGEGIWIGYNESTGESISYIPHTNQIREQRQDSGYISYGFEWTSRWINMGAVPLVILELCLPPYATDNTVVESREFPQDAQIVSRLNKVALHF